MLRVINIGGSSNGRTVAFEAINWGSSPCPPAMKKRQSYYAYVLECKDKTFYVGSTNNLEKRLFAHNNLKSGAHYTKIRRPVVLKYSEKFLTLKETRKREAELKRLKREEKIKLIKCHS